MGGSLTVVGEKKFGKNPDQPSFVLGGNLNLGYQRFTQITAAGVTTDSPPSTFLKNAGTGSAIVNGSYSPTYYGTSKTPKLSIFAEVSGSATLGMPYAGTSGKSFSAATGLGIVGNFRLDGGATILSVGVSGGVKVEWDKVDSTSNATAGYSYAKGEYGLGFVGLSWK